MSLCAAEGNVLVFLFVFFTLSTCSKLPFRHIAKWQSGEKKIRGTSSSHLSVWYISDGSFMFWVMPQGPALKTQCCVWFMPNCHMFWCPKNPLSGFSMKSKRSWRRLWVFCSLVSVRCCLGNQTWPCCFKCLPHIDWRITNSFETN